MIKTYKINGLDCAHCAAKLEKLIGDIDGISESKIAFVMQKLKVDVAEENTNSIVEKIFKVVEDFGEGEVTLKEI